MKWEKSPKAPRNPMELYGQPVLLLEMSLSSLKNTTSLSPFLCPSLSPESYVDLSIYSPLSLPHFLLPPPLSFLTLINPHLHFLERERKTKICTLPPLYYPIILSLNHQISHNHPPNIFYNFLFHSLVHIYKSNTPPLSISLVI